jgi:CYTH domain-containing protein
MRRDGKVQEERAEWERLRWAKFIDLQMNPHIKKQQKPRTPKDWIRFEWEKEINWEEAKQLLTLCHGNIIDKTRWLIPAVEEGLYWEVDEFHGHKEGLTIAEIELSAEDQSVVIPDFVGQEVTSDRQYYNSNM